jgi:molybdopterin synthase catalytic subunit
VRIEARLLHEPFDPASELAALEASGAGAVVSFTGIARDRSREGAPVIGLFLDHHPRLTEASLREAAATAAERFDLHAVRVLHRCGSIAPGEPIVFAAAAAEHRRAAFDAVDYLMDRLKTDAVFWKREDRADGSAWIEPTKRDRDDRARWQGGGHD